MRDRIVTKMEAAVLRCDGTLVDLQRCGMSPSQQLDCSLTECTCRRYILWDFSLAVESVTCHTSADTVSLPWSYLLQTLPNGFCAASAKSLLQHTTITVSTWVQFAH